MSTASAPGKLIVSGEYAVLEGAPALVVAVDRRAVARVHDGPRGSSPFLAAVAEEVAAAGGDPARALAIAVDSSAFYVGAMKLGLGSSAAVTVAATALALGAPLDRPRVLAIASAAHARAQGARGARGSGADIAAAVLGGAIEYTVAAAPAPRRWPAGLAIVPFFTGASADTATLVAAVAAARAVRPDAVAAALAAIAAASRAACAACATRDPALAAPALIAALALASAAMDQLAVAAQLPLVPACVTRARAALTAVGGTAKTTGAGGGDVGVAVIPNTPEHATATRRYIIEAGGQPLDLAVDQTGVDLHASAQ